MIKRKISLVIVLMMVLSLMIPNFTLGATKDYLNHWAEKDIQEWVDNGQLKGYENGSVKPDQTITRAEFMTMVNSAFKITVKGDVSFKDVNSSDWYYVEVQKAVANGYIIGYEDNTVRPNNKITRQEAALIISRIKILSESSVSAKIFTDYYKIATWSVGGVGAVAKEKIMIGYEDNTFRPERFITRAEALVTIDRSEAVIPVINTPDPTPTPNSGNGSSNGNGNSGNEKSYAVLSGLNYNNGTTTSAISLASNFATVTRTAINSTVTLSAITTTGTSVTFATATTGAAIATSSAIAGTMDATIVFDAGVNTAVITITVSNSGDYDREYLITINRIL